MNAFEYYANLPMSYLELSVLAEDEELQDSINDLHSALGRGEITYEEWRPRFFELVARMEERHPEVMAVLDRLEREKIKMEIAQGKWNDLYQKWEASGRSDDVVREAVRSRR